MVGRIYLCITACFVPRVRKFCLLIFIFMFMVWLPQDEEESEGENKEDGGQDVKAGGDDSISHV